MQLVPVIDLSCGLVVHAKCGDRNNYQPLKSTLCTSSTPLAVVAGLKNLYPFTHLYIADLDAIQGQPVQAAILTQLHKHFPELKLWVDTGIRNIQHLDALHNCVPATPVLGTETLIDASILKDPAINNDVILSIDYHKQSFLGSDEIHNTPALWPKKCIAMTLDRVGTNQGPDLKQLCKLHDSAPDTEFYAAGGVRNLKDLYAIQSSGCSGALLASALHNGSLTTKELEKLITKQQH